MEVKPYKVPHPFRKLNKKLIDSVVKDIKRGSTHRLASQANGITPRILEIWRKQGEVDIEHEQDSLPAYLVRALSTVKQEEVIWCRENIKKADKGHKGAEWTLEHAYQRDFSSNVALQEISDEFEELKLLIKSGAKNVEVNSEEEK